jgi:fibronectin type 3 domain-containing protein
MTTRSRVLTAFVVVLALGVAGCGSSDPAGVPVDTVPPAAVLEVAPTVTTTGIHVSWAASSEADLAGYQVLRGVGATGQAVLVGTVSTNEYVDTTVQRGVLYRYEVAAFDQSGNVGPLVESTTVSFNTETRGRRGERTGD